MSYICGMQVSTTAPSKRASDLFRYKTYLDELDKHDCSEVPITVIYRKYIKPKFHISRSTLYRAINSEPEVRAMFS